MNETIENEVLDNPCADDITGYTNEGTPICSNRSCLHNLGGWCIPDPHIGD